MNSAPRMPETLDEDLSFAKGSPLFSVLTRMGLLPADGRQLAATLSVFAWLPLLILSAFAGTAIGNAVRFPFLLDFPNAVRFLVALPLLVMGEGPVSQRTRELADYLFRSGLVDGRTAQSFSGLVRQTRRMRDSRLAEAVAGVIVLFAAISLRVEFSAATDTWQFVANSSGSTRSAAGWWYAFVSVPIFQFLLYRWLWRYVIWCWFLWRLSKLDLVLMPSHPDGSAGLAYLGHVQAFFGIITFAGSTIVAAHVAQEALHGRPLITFRVDLAIYLAGVLIAFLAPLLIFTRRLYKIRRGGLRDYGSLAAEYTRAFDRKWIERDTATAEPLLGSADIQSLADLGNSYDVIRNMRTVPFELRTTVIPLVVATAAPFLPLVFLVISPFEVLKALVRVMV